MAQRCPQHCPQCERPLTDTVPDWGRCSYCKGLFRIPRRQDVPRPVEAWLSLYRDPGTLTLVEEPLRGERVAGTILLGLSVLGVSLAVPVMFQGINILADNNPGGFLLNLAGFLLFVTCLRTFFFAWQRLFRVTTYLFDAGCVTVYRDDFLIRQEAIVIDRSLLERPFPLQHVKYLMLPLAPDGKGTPGFPPSDERGFGGAAQSDSFGGGTDYPGVFHGIGIPYENKILRVRTGGTVERRWLAAALIDFFESVPYVEQLYRRQLDRLEEGERETVDTRNRNRNAEQPARRERTVDRPDRGDGRGFERRERLDRVPRSEHPGESRDAGRFGESPEDTEDGNDDSGDGPAVLELHCPKCRRTVPVDSFDLAEETVQCFWCRNVFPWREAAEEAEREAGRFSRPSGSRLELSFPEGHFGKTLHLLLPPRRWFGRATLVSLVAFVDVILTFLWYVIAIAVGLGFLIGALGEQGLNLQDHYNDRLIEFVVEQHARYGLGILGALAAWFAVGAVFFGILRWFRRLLGEHQELTLTSLTLKLTKTTPYLTPQSRLFPRENFLYLATDTRAVPGSVYRFGSGRVPLYLVMESGTVEIACRNEAERRWIRAAINSYAGDTLEE